jgi:hypothetical protein
MERRGLRNAGFHLRKVQNMMVYYLRFLPVV